MNVSIVGGTGFLGYHCARECLRRNHAVRAVSLPDLPPGDWFPRQIPLEYGDVFAMPDDALRRLFRGADAVVYAVGPDDRITPQAPAYDFFHERLVVAAARVMRAAREAGVTRGVLLNSYFAYFDRVWPWLRLAERHPYIRCRVEQAEALFQTVGDGMDVMVLELPFVWGAMPLRPPLWKAVLLDRIRKLPLVPCSRGGSSMIAVEHVAEAVAGALECGKGGTRYPIGDVDMDWKTMLAILLDAMGSWLPIVPLPRSIFSWAGRRMRARESRQGRESGLNPACLFEDLMTRQLYVDPLGSVAELGHGRGGVVEAMQRTVAACATSFEGLA